MRSFSGSHRRPISPTIPPRSKADPPPRRAISLPRIPGPEPAESSDNPATPGAVNPVADVPTAQASESAAAQSQDQPSAPEVTSDAETLALPGVPGTDENGPPPSPVEEEPPSATVDPYVSTVEAATEGTTSTETPSVPAPTEHESIGESPAEPQGFGGLVQILPKPSTPEEKEVASTPAIEAGTSQSTGEAEAGKPSSGEPEPSKPPVEEKKPDNPEAAPKAKAKSVSTRKQKEAPKETPEQKEQREKAEKMAEELVQQEEAEKRKQEAKDAKSKKAAAENTEKAREAAAEQRKAKEQAAESEQTVAQKRRIKAAIPDNVPRDDPPPRDDDQPWQIYQYRPHAEPTPTLAYEEEESGVKHYDLESAYNLDLLGARTLCNSGQATPVSEPVKFLQNGTRRVREIRAEQIERLAAVQPIVPSGPHQCVVKGGLLMRVSTPYHKNGKLMLGTFPGMAPRKYKVKPQLVPYLSLTSELDKVAKKPDLLTHLAIHTAANAIGYETRAGNARADNKADWFTPEVLRAARVFLKELSTAQYTNTGGTKIAKPGFLYYPSELTEVVDEANKGRWVHLVSLGLQVSHIQWTVMRTLPFYVRGLLREVPIALIPDVCTIAALTDSDLEVLMDQHLMLWVRSKTWSECRPFAGTKEMNLGYQESLVTPLATVTVTEMELAEAFLEQQNEGPQPVPTAPDPKDDTIEEGVVAGRPALSIHEKPKGKGKNDDKGKGKGKGRPRSGTPVPSGPVTRSAYIMPTDRYLVASEGVHNTAHSKHYAVVFDVMRAVQYGTVFSPAVNTAGIERGSYVTSGIPANAIVQIKTGNGQVINPNSLGTSIWDSKGPGDVQTNAPTIKVTGRAEMPSLEIYHAQLSPQENSRWSRRLRDVQTFPEGHLDEQIGERGLRKAIPPTGISYAEFVGMRPRTMSQMPFRKEGKLTIIRDDRQDNYPDLEKVEKGEGRGKKKKGRGKGRLPLHMIKIKDVDPIKLRWEPAWNKDNEPHKGRGRSNYRAFSKEALYSLVETMMVDQAIANGDDPNDVRVVIPPDEVPVHPTKKGKGGENKRTKGEHLDSIENKRARLGGPACLPESWRNRSPSSMIMSFDMPERDDGSMVIFYQANSQLPAFGRYVIECSEQERPNRVLNNPMGAESLWAPQTASPWDVCKKDNENYRFDTAENHGECALCKGAKATELVPCCWCTNWVHLRCSYAVPSGRACASHFDVQNPLEKQVVACNDDPLVPEEFRERPVFPNIVIPRYQPNKQGGPKAAMNNMELMWIYRHAWRGAGLYYRKGDHVVTQESQGDKPSSMFKAMTMYPVWDKWIMPRCDAIPERYIEDPERWNLSKIDDVRAPQEIPPLGRLRWEYLLLDQLSHEQGNLFRLWYEELEPHEQMFWHAYMHKASLKQEYRWEDHCKEPLLTTYEPVKDFDPRFFYYDHYQMITQELLQPTSIRAEEAKCEDWAILEEDLEPGLALDPNSYAAKVKKRKEPPTEADVLSSVRKRPATPPQEAASVAPPTSAVTPQGQATEVSSLEAATPTTVRATSAVPAISSQETLSGQSQPTEVSPTTLSGQGMQQITAATDVTPSTTTEARAATTAQSQAIQGTESQSSQQEPSQGTVQVAAMQSSAGQSDTQEMGRPEDPSQQDNLGDDDPRRRRIDKLTRIMLESIHSQDIGINPASEMIYQAVLNFAEYATQFDHLAMAEDKLSDYAGSCMSSYCNNYAQRALQGFEDDPDLVDAVCMAQDAMPTLLPVAFAACIEAEQREAMARSIEAERERKQQAEIDQRVAELEECEKIQRELEEEERARSRHVNADQITQLMINRMVQLAEQSQAGEPGTDLVGSLTNSLRSFFEQTTSEDAQYLTRSATEYVSNMRDAEIQRIRRATPDTRAAMVIIRHAGKFLTQLPAAIEQVLQVVQFTALAPPTGSTQDHPAMDEHQAEYEENEPPEEEHQGPPSSGTPPGTPPPWNPRRTTSTGHTGRVQEAVQKIEGPPIVSVPAPKWHGWKTQTGPTIADVEQSRMSPFGEPDLDTPDAELREAMARSLQETRHDPYELPNTGGSSGSGAVAQHVPSPQQVSTPNTQSEGEGSVIPKGQQG